MKKLTLTKVLPWLLIIGGVIGLIASALVLIEKIDLLQNPSYQPICNINPIVSCGSVMSTSQSHIFGVTNPLIGLIAFPVLITTGVVLAQGARLKRWYWLGLELGAVFGIGFVHWLFFETVYRINALCPYCMVVWVVTITTFWYVTMYNLQVGHINPPRRLIGLTDWLRHHHFDILVLWFLILFGLILKHFWYYYGPGL